MVTTLPKQTPVFGGCGEGAVFAPFFLCIYFC